MRGHWTRLGVHRAKCCRCGAVLFWNKVWCDDEGLKCPGCAPEKEG